MFPQYSSLDITNGGMLHVQSRANTSCWKDSMNTRGRHPVKVAIIGKRMTKKSSANKSMLNPQLAVDEITMKVLESIEDLPVTVQQENSRLE
eukprot:gene28948-35906_t